MDYDNTNRGSLFRNDRKEKDTHPEYKGTINVNGEEFWISGWMKVSKDGTKKYMSLSVSPKEAKAAPKVGKASQGSGFDDVADDIPF